MVLKTKRWNDPAEADDGFRLLICRYRPRGVRKEDQTWHAWWPNLGPSRELHADFYGKHGEPISWEDYRRRYLQEMKAQQELIERVAGILRERKKITLLCSSACVEPTRCHRTLLKRLVERVLERLG